MPAWITIYCQQAADDVTAEMIDHGIRLADFYTLAEDYDIDESTVGAALAHLQIERVEDEVFKISYQEPETRPLWVRRWTHPNRLTTELAEVTERLANKPKSVIDRVQLHLQQTQEVVGIELGFSQLEDMGIVIAFEIARWLALNQQGLIETVDQNWWTVDSLGGAQLIAP